MNRNLSWRSRFRVVLVGGLTPYVFYILGGMDPLMALGPLIVTLFTTLFAVGVFVPDPPGQDPAGPFLRYLVAEFRRWPWTVPHATRRWCGIVGILAPVGMGVALALQGTGWFGFFFMLSLAPMTISITWYFGWFDSLTGQNESRTQPLA